MPAQVIRLAEFRPPREGLNYSLRRVFTGPSLSEAQLIPPARPSGFDKAILFAKSFVCTVGADAYFEIPSTFEGIPLAYYKEFNFGRRREHCPAVKMSLVTPLFPRALSRPKIPTQFVWLIYNDDLDETAEPEWWTPVHDPRVP